MSSFFPVARTAHLPETELFQHPTSELTIHEQWKLSFERAKVIAQLYGITAHDILTLSEKFWEFHMDNIGMMDAGAITVLSIQYNLAAGTIAPFAMKRPDLQPLLQHILDLDVAAQFMLTEVVQAHGLDAMNLETTATLLANGEFDLHTPNDGAQKLVFIYSFA